MVGEQKTIIIKDIYDMMKQSQLKVPSYQRNYVWNIEQQTLLIDSILKGHYIGQMVLAESKDSNCYDIIDGQQRIKTIYFFIENGFKITKDDQALDEKAQQEFLNYPLRFYIIDELFDTEQVVEIFQLINTAGEPLTPQELRHAEMKNNFSSIVSELAIEIFPDRRNITNSESSKQAFLCSIWNRLGILTKQQLLKMQDEELIARIILSAMFDKHLQPNDALLNEAYSGNGLNSSNIICKLTKELIKQIKSVFDLLRVTTFNVDYLSKEGFYIIFMALYDVIIIEQKNMDSPDLLIGVFNNINSLKPSNQTHKCQYDSLHEYAKYLIRLNCFDGEESQKIGMLKNILSDAKVETAKYEFKQGLLRLSDDRKKDKDLNNQILETICGMANANFMEPAYLLIGIADKESDANRINALDSIKPLKLADHYIVGIEREAKVLKISVDQYCAQIKDIIDHSNLSQALKLSVLTNIDIITYHGLSVVVIIIPPQKEISFIADRVFVRKCSSTTEVTNAREIIALASNFSHGE